MALSIKKRTCRFCENHVEFIDFKEVKVLNRFVTDQGAIIPRRVSGNCALHQRQLSRAVKRARALALMAYATESTR